MHGSSPPPPFGASPAHRGMMPALAAAIQPTFGVPPAPVGALCALEGMPPMPAGATPAPGKTTPAGIGTAPAVVGKRLPIRKIRSFSPFQAAKHEIDF